MGEEEEDDMLLLLLSLLLWECRARFEFLLYPSSWHVKTRIDTRKIWMFAVFPSKPASKSTSS